MKSLLLATAIAAISVSAVHAQTYRTYSNGFGGATTYGSNGFVAQTYNNGFGGSTTYGPNGSFAQTYNNGFGGSTTYVHPGFNRGW
jgi:hypothetical protein